MIENSRLPDRARKLKGILVKVSAVEQQIDVEVVRWKKPTGEVASR